jgi:thioredoxin reductase (NADPH)
MNVDASDPTDPYNREPQTFPELSAEMTARVATFGMIETVPGGTLLFERGERSVDFFLVLKGAIEIVDTAECDGVNVLTVHGPFQFTGELDLFNDRRILVGGRTLGETEVVRVKRADFRRLVTAEPDIGEIIMRALILRRVGLIRHAQGGVMIVGAGHAGDTLRIQRFLTRNGYPHRLLDTEHPDEADGFLDAFGVDPSALPVVVAPGETLLRNPSNAQLADALGLTEDLDPDAIYDLVVVGAGPAGLAAAVYGASEGLSTIVVEALAPGGQAGTSSKIENYLGFPTGISGQALAGRAQVQAQKFGARLLVSRPVVTLQCDDRPYVLRLEEDRVVQARSVIIATGARYRRLDVPDYERFEAQGIHYAATPMEGALCRNEEVIVVGGGNSAGQAAMFLSGIAKHVYILVRSTGLAASMSDYLVQRIAASERVTLMTETDIVGLSGDQMLREVEWRNRRTGETARKAISNVFVMIGAQPNTDWLEGCVELDDNGFVLTGPRVAPYSDLEAGGPSPYQTSRPGVFAVGDVRSGSVKRVASGVGEGSVVVQAVHRYLALGE